CPSRLHSLCKGSAKAWRPRGDCFAHAGSLHTIASSVCETVSRSRREQRLDVLLRIERLQILELLADADELHRQIELALDAEDGAALGGAVELCEDDAGTLDRLLELLRPHNRILTARSVEHEKDFMRRAGNAFAHDAMNLLQLAHEVSLRVQ